MDGELEPRTDVEEGLNKGDEPMETTPSTELCSDEQHEGTGVMTTDVSKAPEDNDDDVVLVEGPDFQEEKKAASPSSNPAPAETTDGAEPASTAAASSSTPSPSSTAAAAMAPESHTEPIVIDDEEDSEQRDSSSPSLASSQAREALSSTEPDSEIKIASVTTLGGSCSSEIAMPTPTETSIAPSDEESINLKITSVTSLKGNEEAETGGELEAAENGLQISSTFSLNPEAQQSQDSPSKPSPTFNPGRVNSATQPVQNGETGTHQRSGNAWTMFLHHSFDLLAVNSCECSAIA